MHSFIIRIVNAKFALGGYNFVICLNRLTHRSLFTFFAFFRWHNRPLDCQNQTLGVYINYFGNLCSKVFNKNHLINSILYEKLNKALLGLKYCFKTIIIPCLFNLLSQSNYKIAYVRRCNFGLPRGIACCSFLVAENFHFLLWFIMRKSSITFICRRKSIK